MNLQEQLADAGYALIPRDAAERPRLRTIFSTLGAVRVARTRLHPRTREFAVPRTLSARFGLAEFPRHTDYAHHVVPARFLALVASRPRSAGTHLFDGALLRERGHFMRRALFRVGATRRPFLAPLVNIDRQRAWVRYNPALMTPVTPHAEAAVW